MAGASKSTGCWRWCPGWEFPWRLSCGRRRARAACRAAASADLSWSFSGGILMGQRTRLSLGLCVTLLVVAKLSGSPTVETHRIPQFENAHVKVWRSVILPNQPLSPHRHEHGRVIIAIQGGTIRIAEVS